MKKIKRRNFSDLPMTITDAELANAKFSPDVLVKVSNDKNTAANAVLVGLAATGFTVGTAAYMDVVDIKVRLNSVANILESKLGLGASVWRQVKKGTFYVLAKGMDLIGIGFGGTALAKCIANYFPEAAAQLSRMTWEIGSELNKVSPELASKFMSAAAGSGAKEAAIGAGAGSLGALIGYKTGTPKTGEKEALDLLKTRVAEKPFIQNAISRGAEAVKMIGDKSANVLNVAKDKFGQLVKMKHFSNTVNKYYFSEDAVEAEVISDEEYKEAVAAKKVQKLISVSNDSSSLLETLLLAGLAAVAVGYGAKGLMSAAEAEQRLAAVAKDLSMRNSFWFKLKSSLLYPFKTPVGDEIINQLRTRQTIDVARGLAPAQKLSGITHSALNVLT